MMRFGQGGDFSAHFPNEVFAMDHQGSGSQMLPGFRQISGNFSNVHSGFGHRHGPPAPIPSPSLGQMTGNFATNQPSSGLSHQGGRPAPTPSPGSEHKAGNSTTNQPSSALCH